MRQHLRLKAQLEVISSKTGIRLGTVTTIYEEACGKDLTQTIAQCSALSASIREDLKAAEKLTTV